MSALAFNALRGALHVLSQGWQVDSYAPTDPSSFELTASHVAPESRVGETTKAFRLRVTDPFLLYRFLQHQPLLFGVFLAFLVWHNTVHRIKSESEHHGRTGFEGEARKGASHAHYRARVEAAKEAWIGG